MQLKQLKQEQSNYLNMIEKNKKISIFGFPFDKGSNTRGCSLGPQSLRIAGLVNKLANLGYEIKDYEDLIPSRSKSDNNISNQNLLSSHNEVKVYFQSIFNFILESNTNDAINIFLGGDHSISFGSIAAVAHLCSQKNKELVVIWLDAHADFNSPSISPTGNWHGMPLSYLSGNNEFLNQFNNVKFPFLKTKNIYLFGVRSLDTTERMLIQNSGINVFDMRLIDEFEISNLVKKIISEIDKPNVHVHLSFDADFLDPEIAPGVGTPVKGGITYREAHLIMEILHESCLIQSIDVVELNPFLDNKGKTSYLLVELLESLFGKCIVC